LFPFAISGSQEIVPKSFRSEKSLPVPLNLLIEWHNLSPAESVVREQIKNYLIAFGEANEKAHWARGLLIQEDGDLKMDNQLWDYAIYRGKQETYINSAKERFEKLQSDLAMVAHNQEREADAAKELSGKQFNGTPLVPVRDLSETARRLQAGATALKATVNRMGLGMAETLAPPTTSDLIPIDTKS